jgi:hypothetical protein
MKGVGDNEGACGWCIFISAGLSRPLGKSVVRSRSPLSSILKGGRDLEREIGPLCASSASV